MITVIIATLNRPKLLSALLTSLASQSIRPDEIIISDASSIDLRLNISHFSNLKIRYLISSIRSAAQQRNMALDCVNKSTKYLVILDDDIRIANDYIEKCISLISKTNSVGVSGITKPTSKKSGSWLAYLFRLMFLLDSKKECSVTAGGVNIPIKVAGVHKISKSEWLFGCSVWNYESIFDLRFPKNFIGQSLFEDVIFSLKASKRGSLFVSTDILLINEQSLIERPNSREFHKMWIANRYEVIRERNGGFISHFAFHWSNLGKFIYLISSIFFNPKTKFLSFYGCVEGYFQLYTKY